MKDTPVNDEKESRVEEEEEENEVIGSVRTAGLYVEAARSVFVCVCVSVGLCAQRKTRRT